MSDTGVILFGSGIAAFGALVWWRRSSVNNQFEKLSQEMEIDRAWKDTVPMIAISLKSQEIGLAYTDMIKRLPFSKISSWQHKWTETSSAIGVTTSAHRIEFAARDLNSPRFEVKCLTRADAEDLNAALDLAISEQIRS